MSRPVCWIAGRSPGWTALGPSEEHLPVDVTGGPAPVRGEIVWLITRHICCTINLADKVCPGPPLVALPTYLL